MTDLDTTVDLGAGRWCSTSLLALSWGEAMADGMAAGIVLDAGLVTRWRRRPRLRALTALGSGVLRP